MKCKKKVRRYNKEQMLNMTLLTEECRTQNAEKQKVTYRLFEFVSLLVVLCIVEHVMRVQ